VQNANRNLELALIGSGSRERQRQPASLDACLPLVGSRPGASLSAFRLLTMQPADGTEASSCMSVFPARSDLRFATGIKAEQG